jgi:Skp family chaperone for outer membrane proteins
MLDPVVESLDTVDEKYRDLYQEADGKHVLKVNSKDGWALENVDGLKTALASERKVKAELESIAKKFDGLDADKARDALARMEKLASGEPDEQTAQRLKAFEDKLKAKYEAESKSVHEPLEKTKQELQSVKAQLSEVLIDRAALEALSKAGGEAELLMPHVRSRLSLQEHDGKLVTVVLDKDGQTARISPAQGSTALMTVDELVAELKANPVYGRAFAGNPNTGTAGVPKSTPQNDTNGASPNVRQHEAVNNLANVLQSRGVAGRK